MGSDHGRLAEALSAAAPAPEPIAGDRPIRVPGGKWSIWPTACLRGAGFPVSTVIELSSPATARLARTVLQQRTPDAIAALKATFAAERRRIRAALRDLARSPRFREAIVWQNRRAFRHAVGAIATAPVDHLDSDIRKKELLVASYAQRYAAKNDTIGFFGPVGWARFSDSAAAATVACGPSLIAARQVCYEAWCIDSVARALDARPALRPWRVPRIQPFVRLDGARAMMAARVVLDLSAAERDLFAACDGARHAQAIAADLVAAHRAPFPNADAVYDLLERWVRDGYLTWTFEGGRELEPERTLRARLQRIDDASLRAAALADLDAIDGARDALRLAAGDADRLDRAFEDLEAVFSRVTGTAATRAEGQMYAARTLVYEDCRRDVRVELGADVVRRLGPPLSLVLHSARWAVHELAARHGAAFRRAFDDLSGGGRKAVALGAFLGRTSLVGDTRGSLSPIAVGVRDELQRRWAGILGAPPAAHRIAFRSRDLRPLVWEAFPGEADPPSTWARHIGPDVMIDATSVDAINHGDYQIVLGELHIINTLAQSAFMTQCPDPAGILEPLHRDCPEPRVYWLAAKEGAPQRVQHCIKANDFVYVASRDPSPVPAARTLPIGDLVVVDADGALVVETRDGRLRFPCLEFFGYLMMRKEVNLFGVLGAAPHRPRVTIDEVVVCREQWQVRAADVAFASRGDDLDRFVECQRWTHERGMPRHVFVRLPTERKPTYVDFSSPLFVDLLSRAVRILQRGDPEALVTITEMLPAPAGAWLTDASGARYTSELRLVAVDPTVSKRLKSAAR